MNSKHQHHSKQAYPTSHQYICTVSPKTQTDVVVSPDFPVLTTHASIRMQQRGIPDTVIDALVSFGSSVYDHRGAIIRFFDKRAIRRCLNTWGESAVKELDRYFNVYLVQSVGDGTLVTVGHRHSRLPRG